MITSKELIERAQSPEVRSSVYIPTISVNEYITIATQKLEHLTDLLAEDIDALTDAEVLAEVAAYQERIA